MNVRRLSLTRRYTSESPSDLRELLMPAVRRDMTTSHSSSMFLQDRNVPVLSRTCDSMMKKPVISCVYVGRDERRSDGGRIKSDCAYHTRVSRDSMKERQWIPFYRPGKSFGAPREVPRYHIYVYIGREVWNPLLAYHCSAHWLKIAESTFLLYNSKVRLHSFFS